MRTRFDAAQEIPKKGYASMKDGIDAVAPALRRVVEDKQTREALRDLLSAGQEVREQLRGDGAKAVMKDFARDRRLGSDIESSAKALHSAANAMAKARKKQKRRMVGRAMTALALVGGLAMMLKKRSRTARGDDWSSGDNRLAQWPHPADGGDASARGTDRPSGAPIRTA